MALAVLLTAGLFKADDRLAWLPLDLTLMSALVVVGLVVLAFARSFVIPKPILLVLLFFALFVPTLFWTEWHPYAIEKTKRFFTLTLLSAIAPFFLIRTSDQLRRFLSLLGLVGVVVSLDSLFGYFFVGGTVNRLTGFNSTTIGLGAYAGLTGLWTLVMWQCSRIKTYVALPTILTVGFVVLGTGSRGPLLGLTLTMLLLLLWRGKAKNWKVVHSMTLIGILAFLLPVILEYVPSWSLFRLQTFIRGDFGDSELFRYRAQQLAVEQIQTEPLGTGLGGFAKTGAFDWEERSFPHNLVLEVFCEGGWITGLFFLFLLYRAFKNAYLYVLHSNGGLEARMLFAFVLFLFLNVLVAGELNDWRVFFGVMGCCVGLVVDTSHAVTFETKTLIRPARFHAVPSRSA